VDHREHRGTSINSPTTVAKAAPDQKPKGAMAAGTAISKQSDAPIKAEGPGTHHSPSLRISW
jgi:hypothetical protein